jgi:predicted HTH transcriptional regulator
MPTLMCFSHRESHDQKKYFLLAGVRKLCRILFGSLTLKDLEKDDYISSIRNKLLAEAFFLTGDIEKYGAGFIRIRKKLKEKGILKRVGPDKTGYWKVLEELTETDHKK